jgi:hypothetical protein
MPVLNIKPFHGQHCETTATGTLLNQLGIELSEPMLFGLGEGLGFIFWKMKNMERPFIGGRIKPDALTQRIATNLQLELTVKETASPQKAWQSVQQFLDKGQVVGLKLDCFHLEYFTAPFHFAGHYAALYGYDDTYAYLVDTLQQGGQVKTSLKSLALARAEKGPMASKNLYFTFQPTNTTYNLESALTTAIRNNAREYINPPIANIGYRGIDKTSTEIIKWYHSSKDIATDFRTTALLMEKAGTGGALFRNLYRDFLKESFDLLNLPPLKQGYEAFSEIATLWSTVSKLFLEVSETKDIHAIHQASAILKTLSVKEKNVMESLATL